MLFDTFTFPPVHNIPFEICFYSTSYYCRLIESNLSIPSPLIKIIPPYGDPLDATYFNVTYSISINPPIVDASQALA
jgi:hypothetical protein